MSRSQSKAAQNKQIAERFMRRALSLARRAREKTWPNPMVGAVVVKKGRIIAEGYHKRAGEAHAEAEALARAGRRARGADLYVTLEPCHCTGCTGPCTEGIQAAGIRRVIVGTCDPNPKECGRGLAKLRSQRIEVITGILEDECRRLNEVYNITIQGRRPFVLLKAAAGGGGAVRSAAGLFTVGGVDKPPISSTSTSYAVPLTVTLNFFIVIFPLTVLFCRPFPIGESGRRTCRSPLP